MNCLVVSGDYKVKGRVGEKKREECGLAWHDGGPGKGNQGFYEVKGYQYLDLVVFCMILF